MGLALANTNAPSPRRSSRTAYGNARHHRMADLDGDGATTSADFDLIRGLGGSWGEYGIGDLNRDGIVNSADTTLLNNDMVVGNALPAGRISLTDNIIGYAGYIFNAEMYGSGLYTVRHRVYSPELGRWLTRDPIGYVDGMGLYEYVLGRPMGHVDYWGLCAEKCDGCKTATEHINTVDDIHKERVENIKKWIEKDCPGCSPSIHCRTNDEDGNCKGFKGYVRKATCPDIIICCDQNKNVPDVKMTIVHEYIHVYDQCAKSPMPPGVKTECDKCICMEVRAMLGAGQGGRRGIIIERACKSCVRAGHCSSQRKCEIAASPLYTPCRFMEPQPWHSAPPPSPPKEPENVP